MDRAHKVDLDHSRKTSRSRGGLWIKKGQTFKEVVGMTLPVMEGGLEGEKVSSDTDYRQEVCNQCL